MAIDYVSKCVKAITKVVLKFFKKHIFTWFSAPMALLSDNGTHLQQALVISLEEYGFFTRLLHPITPKQVVKQGSPTMN